MDMKMTKLAANKAVMILSLVLCLWLTSSAHAFTVTSNLEVIKISNVGNTFQTVSLDNSYTNAIPVCTYNLPSNVASPAVVRINSITANSFEVRVQNPSNSAVTKGDVHCIITDEGSYILPDGLKYEARTVSSDGTNGKKLGWSLNQTENVTKTLTHTFDSPIVLGQVISSNDSRHSSFWSHGGNRRNPPRNSNISVGKQVGEDADKRADELLGFVVIESGTGSGNINGIDYVSALGADIILGVASSTVSYSLPQTFDHGVATISAMDSKDGGWAVLFGESPLDNAAVSLGIDEDGNRSHTTEQVAYWMFDTVDVADLDVTIDDGNADYAPGEMITYTMTIKNNGPNNADVVNVLNESPLGTTNIDWHCTGVSCPNATGSNNIDEIASTLNSSDSLVYTVNVAVPDDQVGVLVNTVSASNLNVDPVRKNDIAHDTNSQSVFNTNVNGKTSGAILWLPIVMLLLLLLREQEKKVLNRRS